MKRDKVTAIIAGIGSYNDLGLIRSCGEAGCKVVYLIDSEELQVPIYKSKYIESYHFLSFEESSLLEKINLITVDTQSTYIIFPASDSAVLAFDHLIDSLPKNVWVSNAKGQLEKLMDKSVMAQMAKNTGLDVPETQIFDLSESSIQKLKIPFPVIIKPLSSIAGEKSDIKIIPDLSSFTDYITQLRIKGYSNILVQKYIHSCESKEMGITGISFPDGRVEIHGFIDKLRNRNKINNFGVYYPNVELDFLGHLKAYIKSTKYVGIFDTDFINIGSNWYFIECNFRNGAYGYCTTKAGFNMPERLIQAVLSSTLSANRRLKDVRFMEERTDILNAIDHTISWKEWFLDVCRTNTFLWWNWKDPRPMLRIPSFIKRFVS